MRLPSNKTKIVCTIGPASESIDVMERMIRAGMSVARLNFSHGDFMGHKKAIENLRAVARTTGRRVAIMADLPGPKMRIGQLAEEPIELLSGDTFTLTTQEIVGDAGRASVSFARLPQVVKPKDALFLDDGIIQLEVTTVQGVEVVCRVVVGGELRSRKGLNLPGIDLGISAFTDHDRECLRFAAEQGMDAVSQSFVESGDDITAVRRAAAEIGYRPFIIAKIERARAFDHIDDILDAADGIMVARGDLGVEIPIQRIPIVQKSLVCQANLRGKPVITATNMLESMTISRRPTRAEATDVANAILDGTDCVMLSGESAMGKYPVESTAMLASIAEAIEPCRPGHAAREELQAISRENQANITDLIAYGVETTLEHIEPAAVFVPTHSGFTAKRLTRFRIPAWIVAVSSQEATCQQLQFSYGVHPEHEPDHPDDWNVYVREWLRAHEVAGSLVVLTEGPSSKRPDTNNRMEIIDLKAHSGAKG